MADEIDTPTESRKWKPTARVKADGALFNVDHERVALRLAEGMPFHDCWTAIGKKATDNQQRKYRNHLLRQAVFNDRVKFIMAERDNALAADDIYGEPMFVVMQLYREALAVGDIGRMQKAVEMRLQIAKEIGARRGVPPAAVAAAAEVEQPDAAVEADTPARPVGRPAVESPQTKTSPSDIRKELMARGGPAPDPKVAVQ